MSDTAFHFSDQSRAETLSDLVAILSMADESVTARHVTPERNDYEQWIRHVHNNDALADQVHKCRTPHEVVEVIKKHLAPPPVRELTPLKEKLRALAPKPSLATPKPQEQKPQSQVMPPPSRPHHNTPPPFESSHEKSSERFMASNREPAPEASHAPPPQWTPSTPLPKRSFVSVKNNPHVHDFVLGLVIGIVIGVLAYGLLMQVI